MKNLSKKEQIARQQEFVEWLKKYKMYNEFASANVMQNMMEVWEKCQEEKAFSE